ncbi:MAG: FAD-dependent oxidoreductase [Eubacteriales bacterium]|nr:FAD-dependent oxidoreductase [Eubacteriales bacterium]MDY3332501.1 FAD-dependent oxidoreductase [Gallibacter sp.]
MNNLIILGSGPAAISAALYTQRAGIDTTIIHKGYGALEKAHQIDNYYGVYPSLSGKELHDRGIEQAKALGVKFIEEEVFSIMYTGNYEITTDKNKYEAAAVIMAMGSSRVSSKIKNLKALEGLGVSYCAVCDGFFYRQKNVAVLGNSDYAIHEAQELLPIVGSVTLLTDGKLAPDKCPDGLLIDTREISEILGSEHVEGVLFNDDTKLDVEGVFVALGAAGSSEIARKVGAIIENNKIVVNEDMATNLPGLYAAGDGSSKVLQVYAAVYQGAKAASSVIKYLRDKK